ncbi:MAG: hypothetical protein IJI54_05830 [Kiritimatiellae bacterium]|nr:hypothetical protein [Kiritimatiellia bacterium]
MVNTSKSAKTLYFDCKTVEDSEAFPKVCITSEMVIDKGEIHHVNTDEIKAAIEKAVKTSVWIYPKAKVQNEA